MADFRRGAAAIEAAKEERKKGGFSPFAPSIYWKEDKEEKYILVLNPIDDIPRVDVISFIPVKNDKGETMYSADVIARTDPAIGESEDFLVDNWQARPRDSNLLVAVELEPVLEEKRGRLRPTGFAVKTVEFERRVRDSDGELTDDTETVVSPAYGFICQSTSNFGSILTAFDNSEAPINEAPVKIQRLGKKKDTQYVLTGYPDQDVDVSVIAEYVDGISYLGDELDDVKEQIEGLDPSEAAAVIGSVLLEKRLNELIDEDRYKRLAAGVDETLDPWNNGGKDKEKKSTTPKSTRTSQKKDTSEPKQKDESSLKALEEIRARAKKRTSQKD